MKVLMITPQRPHCGVSIYSADLLKALRESGTVDVTSNPDLQKNQDWNRVARETEGHDVIHIQYHPDLYGFWRHTELLDLWTKWLASFEKPVVVTVHDLILKLFPRPTRSLKDFFYNAIAVPYVNQSKKGKYLRGQFLFSANHLIVHSELMKDYLIDLGMAAEKITVLYPGIPEMIPSSFDFRKKYGLENKRVLTCFGFVRKNKGFEKVIEILPNLPADTVFVIAGAPADPESEIYFNMLQTLAAKLNVTDRVICTGALPQEEVASTLTQSDVLVLPYDSTPQSGTSYALSYMLGAQRPVVISDTPFLKEIARLNPNMFLFHQKDTEALRECLLKAMAKGNSKNSFSTEWSWKKTAQKTWGVYKKVCDVF